MTGARRGASGGQPGRTGQSPQPAAGSLQRRSRGSDPDWAWANLFGLLAVPIGVLIGWACTAGWYAYYQPIIGDSGDFSPFFWSMRGAATGLLAWFTVWLLPPRRMRRLRRTVPVLVAALVIVLMNLWSHAWTSAGGNCSGYARPPDARWHCGN